MIYVISDLHGYPHEKFLALLDKDSLVDAIKYMINLPLILYSPLLDWKLLDEVKTKLINIKNKFDKNTIIIVLILVEAYFCRWRWIVSKTYDERHYHIFSMIRS